LIKLIFDTLAYHQPPPHATWGLSAPTLKSDGGKIQNLPPAGNFSLLSRLLLRLLFCLPMLC